MIVLFRAAAEADLREALAYYVGIEAELGDGFIDEVDQAVARAREHPLAYRVVHGELRRVGLKRFPHGLYYRLVRDEVLVVVACIHPARDPSVWMSRR